MENVTTFEGSYTNTLKMRYTINDSGEWAYTEDIWLAKNVGIVKAVRVGQASSTETGCLFTCGCINQCNDTVSQNTLLGLASYTPNAQTALEYCVPFIPKTADYIVGFGLSNVGNDEANEVIVQYYDNDGQLLGQEDATIEAGSQTSFTKDVATTVDGWAYITTTQPLTGMSLIFGTGETPMFDVDLTAETATSLTAAHIDTTGAWHSHAMLCNPSDYAADVDLTFHPNGGGSTSSQSLSIPAMGSVQYDLSAFSPSGAVEIDSSRPLAGFLLFDGRDSGNKWLGGLSIEPAD